jgi:hypothetical protein
VLGRSVRRRGGCGLRQRSVRRQENPPGAILGYDELHDDVQCAGGDLPSRLFRPAGTGGRFDNDRTGPDPRSQSDVEHVVRHELHDDTTHLSDDLRQNIALAVSGRAPQLSSATDSVMRSSAFSVAA